MRNSVQLTFIICCLLLANCQSQKKDPLIGAWQAMREDTIEGHAVNRDDLNASLGRTTKMIIIFKEDRTVQNLDINGRDTIFHNGTFEMSKDGKSFTITASDLKEKFTSDIVSISDTSLSLRDNSGSGETMKLKKINWK